MLNKEKMLIQKNSQNIFKKALGFIKELFSSKKENINSEEIKPKVKNTTLIDEFQKKKKILNLQKSFENGTVKETDLSEEEKSALIRIYNEQIADLQKDIQTHTRTLQFYNEKILTVQNKLKSNN